MINSLRKIVKGRIIGGILIGGVVIAFGFWGIGDIFRGAVSDTIAQVGDTEVSGIRYSQELRNRMSVMGQQMGTAFTMEQARQFGIDDIVLEEILSSTALDEAAIDLGLTASDVMVRDAIQAQPGFQGYNGPQIIQALQSNGYTEQAYVELMRRDIARAQLIQSVGTGVTPPTGLVNLLHDYINETRIVNYVVLNPGDVAESPAPTEEEIVAFHQAHPELFNAPEYRSITYVAIGAQQVGEQIEVTEEELLAEYENPMVPLGTPEEREIQQLTFDDEATAQAARVRLEAGVEFLAIAQERNLSAEDISRGTLTAQELGGVAADTAFSVEEGGVTEPVEGPFGWLLYHVASIVPATELSFEEARDQLRDNIVTVQAANLIADLANAYSDSSAGGATLPEAAAEIGIEAITVEAVDSAGLLPDGTPAPIPSDANFLEQMSLTNPGDETFLFDGLDQVYYAVRVNGVTPAALRPLETVRLEVENAWTEDTNANALNEMSTETAQEVRESSLDAVAENLSRIVMVSAPLTRESFGEDLGPELLQQIFSVPLGSVVSGLAVNGQDRVIVRIEDVSHPVPDITSEEYNLLGESMATQMAEDTINTFANAAREVVGVETYPAAIDLALGQGVLF